MSVCCTIGFMSPAECVRRVQAATPEEAQQMLCTLEAHAKTEALAAAAELAREISAFDLAIRIEALAGPT